MHVLLSQLGVPPEIQEFFLVEELLFHYGSDTEQFSSGVHRVPTTRHLWVHGNPLASQVVLVPSAMEAIAYLTLNRHRHPCLGHLCFIATGNRVGPGQLQWIQPYLAGRKPVFAFGNELLGRLTDIRIAAGLHRQPVSFSKAGSEIEIRFRHAVYRFTQDSLTLNAFEKAAAIRTGCRTAKPTIFNTYLEQLRYEQHI